MFGPNTMKNLNRAMERQAAYDSNSKNGPPFVASEYVGLPGDRILWIAHDPNTGVCCVGRENFQDAQYDAQGLRSAWWLGYAAAMQHVHDVCGKYKDTKSLGRIVIASRDDAFQRAGIGVEQ